MQTIWRIGIAPAVLLLSTSHGVLGLVTQEIGKRKFITRSLVVQPNKIDLHMPTAKPVLATLGHIGNAADDLG